MARFQSRYLGLRVTIKPQKKTVVNGVLEVEHAERIKFTSGIYTTTDEKIIKKLRELCKRNQHIWEIDEDKIKKAKEMQSKIEALKEEYGEVNEDVRRVAEMDAVSSAIRGTRNVDDKESKKSEKSK